MKREADALRVVLLAASRRGIAWRNNVGQARDQVTGQHIRFGGPPGAGDILGSVTLPGRRFGIPLAAEVKSDTGRQSPEQKIFERAWTQAGGLYVLARSDQELDAAIDDAIRDALANR